jgi:hypothetical protein
MEETVNFDQWITNFKQADIVYMVTYDPETGTVTSVGPSHAFENETYKLVIDTEIAEMIIEGKIQISSCFVDPTSNEFTISEIKSVFKIDDVLHRITEKQWSDLEKFDVYLTFDQVTKTLTVELSEEYQGTKKLPEKFQPVAKRRIVWDGDVEMSFLLTDYNDPNFLYTMIPVKVIDLIGKAKVLENLDVPPKFSIYTRRLFKNYTLEIK